MYNLDFADYKGFVSYFYSYNI